MKYLPLKTKKMYSVPTGNIVVANGEYGLIEYLSIGDYGKDVNLKCDALGLTREIEKVKHVDMMSLEEKWVITISSQYGCSINCNFCDVPKVGMGLNASLSDLIGQILGGISLNPEVKSTNRLNIHFARMGEPTFNFDVINAAQDLRKIIEQETDLRIKTIHPVVSTMMPRNNRYLKKYLKDWMYLKNDVYNGEAGLQLSINSTCERERGIMFSNNSLALKEIGHIMRALPSPIGRKITLNFAIADYEINPEKLLRYFSPENYIIKLTPMHKTQKALENNVITSGDYTTFYPYKQSEDNLKSAGYDVIVFIASREEDEGRITCGNAILSGTRPFDL